MSNQTSFERDKKEFSRLPKFFFRRVKENLACFLFHYFARDTVKLLLEVFFFKGSLVEIFAEKVAKGNSVQNDPNFPAKSLSIYTKIFP